MGSFRNALPVLRFLQQIASVTWVRDLRFGVRQLFPNVALGKVGVFSGSMCETRLVGIFRLAPAAQHALWH